MGIKLAIPEAGTSRLLLPQSLALIASVLLALFALVIVSAHPSDKFSESPKPIVAPVVNIADKTDCTVVKCIALTFDDGPNYLTTPRILKILENNKIHASFFVVGSRVAGNEGILRQMYQDGDEIGNHSWNHPDFTTLKPAQIKQQIDDTQRAIISAGVPAPTLFRPPYGAVDATVRANSPLTIMFWNEDPTDWKYDSSKQIARSVINHAEPGGVVDLHDIYDQTAEALPAIIHELKKRDYHFVTTSQLLSLHVGQLGEYYGR